MVRIVNEWTVQFRLPVFNVLEAQALDGTDTSNIPIQIAPNQYHCDGEELRLRDCDSSPFNCSYDHPAGVRCRGEKL